MKVWLDIISGDEMTSDSYPYTSTFDDACLEVKSKLLTKKANEDFGISSTYPFLLFNLNFLVKMLAFSNLSIFSFLMLAY